MINPVNSLVSTPLAGPGRLGEVRGGPFRDVLAGAIRQVEGFGQSATSSVERVLAGEGEELHTAVLATQRAEMAFDLFLQARNKVVQAYQEIMRMQM